jgi:hypothetical protein
MTVAAAYTPGNLLGLGIYTVSEAATYARVSAAKLARWILGTSRDCSAVIARLDPAKNDERWVTFLDFVQSMAIRDIRITHRIHLDQIRETVEMAKTKFNLDYPFARKHTTWLRGGHISLAIKGYGLIESTGPHKSQLNMRPVVEKYMEDLSYDAEGLAKGYSPFSHKGYRIVFNPRFRFGEPMVLPVPKRKVKPCRYSVVALCEAYASEGGPAGAARALGVNQDAVEAAHKYYFDYLRPSDAV